MSGLLGLSDRRSQIFFSGLLIVICMSDSSLNNTYKRGHTLGHTYTTIVAGVSRTTDTGVESNVIHTCTIVITRLRLTFIKIIITCYTCKQTRTDKLLLMGDDNVLYGHNYAFKFRFLVS